MKLKNTLTTLSLSLLLSACGSNSTSSNDIDLTIPSIDKPKVALILPENGEAMIEGFPIALYVTYPSGEYNIDGITSIDVNWPSFDIHQAGKEIGYIDGNSNELFYYSIAHHDGTASAAADLERQGLIQWYVNNDNQLYRFDPQTGDTTSWVVNETAQFTELTLDEQGDENIWLYDQAEHQLVHFNAQTSQASEIIIEGDYQVAGLSIAEDNFLILVNDAVNHAVLHYGVEENELTHMGSWLLEGFGEQFFNDIALMSDGRIAVSTTDAEHNLYLIVDKDELIGDGPIEDDAELQRVAQFELSETIKQPSGIWPMNDGSWLIITDQAEMFALDSNFNIQEKFDIEFDSINCNQGCTEAIVGGNDQFYAMTDEGLVGYFSKIDGQYSLVQEYQIDVNDEQGNPYSYSGLAHDENSGEFYLVTDQGGQDQEDKLIVLDADFAMKSIHTISFNGETDSSIHQYTAQGLHYSEGDLYVLSEMFTKVLKIDLTGEIKMVIDLNDEDVSTPSDIALKDGLIYITGDHENDEPVPPVSAFEIVE